MDNPSPTDFQKLFPLRFNIYRQTSKSRVDIVLFEETPDVAGTRRRTIPVREFPSDPGSALFDNMVSACKTPDFNLTSTEKQSLNHFKAQCAGDIVRLTQEIRGIRDQTFELCLRVALNYSRILERTNQIKVSESLLAPVRSMPKNILGIIFEMCTLNDYGDSMQAGRAPFLLCQVCRAWRDVAINTPSLWTSPSFNLTARGLKTASSHRACVQMILQRARTQTLKLEINAFESSSGSSHGPERADSRYFLHAIPITPEQRVYTFQALSPLITRTKVFDLMLNEDWYAAFQRFQIDRPMFSSIESLSLAIESSQGPRPRPLGLLSLYDITPNLHTFSLALDNSSDFQSLMLRADRLSEFSLRLSKQSSQSLAAFLSTLDAFLSQCTNAHSLSLNFRAGTTWQIVPVIERSQLPIFLDSVERLSVTVNFVGNADSLLQNFVFPNLTHLVFEVLQYSCEVLHSRPPSALWNGYITMAVLGQISSSLTHLTLLRVSIADPDFYPIFQSLPSLAYLKILNLQCTDPEVFGITAIENTGHLLRLLIDTTTFYPADIRSLLLPRLTHLHVYHPKRPFDSNGLVVMYATLVEMRSKMNLARLNNVLPSSGAFFTLGLSFCEDLCSVSDIMAILERIQARKPLSHVYHEVLENFDGLPVSEYVYDEYVDHSRTASGENPWLPAAAND